MNESYESTQFESCNGYISYIRLLKCVVLTKWAVGKVLVCFEYEKCSTSDVISSHRPCSTWHWQSSWETLGSNVRAAQARLWLCLNDMTAPDIAHRVLVEPGPKWVEWFQLNSTSAPASFGASLKQSSLDRHCWVCTPLWMRVLN